MKKTILFISFLFFGFADIPKNQPSVKGIVYRVLSPYNGLKELRLIDLENNKDSLISSSTAPAYVSRQDNIIYHSEVNKNTLKIYSFSFNTKKNDIIFTKTFENKILKTNLHNMDTNVLVILIELEDPINKNLIFENRMNQIEILSYDIKNNITEIIYKNKLSNTIGYKIVAVNNKTIYLEQSAFEGSANLHKLNLKTNEIKDISNNFNISNVKLSPDANKLAMSTFFHEKNENIVLNKISFYNLVTDEIYHTALLIYTEIGMTAINRFPTIEWSENSDFIFVIMNDNNSQKNSYFLYPNGKEKELNKMDSTIKILKVLDEKTAFAVQNKTNNLVYFNIENNQIINKYNNISFPDNFYILDIIR